MPKQTHLDEKWLNDCTFDWLDACNTGYMAFKCQLCLKGLQLSNVGIEAIKSHSQNAKYRYLVAAKAVTMATADISHR